MKDFFRSWIGIAATIFLAITLIVAGTWYYQTFEGDLLQQHNTNQYQGNKHSQGYIDAHNTRAMDAIALYRADEKRNDAKAMAADLNLFYESAGAIDKAERTEIVQTFLEQHPR